MQTQNFSKTLCLLCILPLTGCARKPTFPRTAPTHENSVEWTESKPVIPDIALPTLADGVWDDSEVSIADIKADRKLISFTFDDAPSKTLERIIAVFVSFNETHPDSPASATVFCNGKRVNAESIPLLHSALSLGFELGNHTHSHPDITTLNQSALRAEIEKTDAVLSEIDGNALHLFRAPYGKLNAEAKTQIQTPIIDWTIDTLDWKNTATQRICTTVLENCFSGAIVLMHDGYENTVDAVKTLLPKLYKKGYQVVSVSKMAKAHGCALQTGKVYIRARKR